MSSQIQEYRTYRSQQFSLIACAADFMETYEKAGFPMTRIEEHKGKSLWNDNQVNTCYVFKRTIQGALMMEDYRYYYVFHIKEWNKYWSTEENADRSSKRGRLGCTLPFDWIVDMLNDVNRRKVACFVIVTPDKFYYMTVEDARKYYKTYGIFPSEKFGVEMIGIEKEKMLDHDPLL